MIINLSWRNIWRNPLRSLVIILAVTAGLVGGMFAAGLYNGMMAGKVETTVAGQSGHLQIHHPKFTEDKDIKFTLKDVEEISEKISEIPGVEGSGRRLLVQGMVASAASSVGVQINGVEPEKEAGLTNLHEKITEGAYFEGIKRNPILVSQKTVDKLKLKLRSKIVITFRDAENNLSGAAFRIAGIFKTEDSAFDRGNVLVRISDLQKIAGMKEQFHEIALRIPDEEALNAAQKELSEIFPAAKTEKWNELAPEINMMIETANTSNYILIIIILIALAFGILNTMLMAVFERSREIGVLMAVGMDKMLIFSMIMIETFMLTLLGAMSGMGVSAGLMAYFGKVGIDLSGKGMSEYGFASMAYPYIGLDFYFQITLLVSLTALLSAIYPALKALKTEPVSAIRGH